MAEYVAPPAGHIGWMPDAGAIRVFYKAVTGWTAAGAVAGLFESSKK